MKTSAFPKILHIGNKQISDLFDGVVEVTEKIDGSQLGLGKINGELVGGPADIGRLIKEVRLDITLEEKENIKEELWKIYKDDFMRHAVSGLPEWYKKKLATGDVDVETVKENGQGV